MKQEGEVKVKIEEIIAELTILESAESEAQKKIDPNRVLWMVVNDRIAALKEAISLLKAHQDNQPNEPLTADELQEMIGQPVYCADIEEWKIVDKFAIRAVSCDGASLYRRKPKEET